jgi:hypothetical protein
VAQVRRPEYLGTHQALHRSRESRIQGCAVIRSLVRQDRAHREAPLREVADRDGQGNRYASGFLVNLID